MRQHKYKAYDKERRCWLTHFSISPDGSILLLTEVGYDEKGYEEFDPEEQNIEILQWTGLKDKNGVDIYMSDLLNVFYTSSDGEHIHDCIYEARYGTLGIEFRFVKLLWEDHGWNQYPINTTLCERYESLRFGGYGLEVPDSWGENYLQGHKWKENDSSTYFEVIGNRYENPELLNET